MAFLLGARTVQIDYVRASQHYANTRPTCRSGFSIFVNVFVSLASLAFQALETISSLVKIVASCQQKLPIILVNVRTTSFLCYICARWPERRAFSDQI